MAKRVHVVAGLFVLILIACSGGTWERACPDRGGQKLNADETAALQHILNAAHHSELRWPDFTSHQGEVKEFHL